MYTYNPFVLSVIKLNVTYKPSVLSVVMLSVIMFNVTYKPIVLSVVRLNVVAPIFWAPPNLGNFSLIKLKAILKG
jgi:hypothetical protein